MALQDLPVVLCLDRGGIVGQDGATHHGCYDMSIYRSIPGAVIAAPRNEIELKDMMYSAMEYPGGPYIIRYPRGYGEGVEWKEHSFQKLQEGKGEKLMDGEEIAVIAAGPVANRAVEAAMKLMEKTGKNPAIYNIRYIKPIDTELLTEICGKFSRIITVEDGTVIGGLYGAVTEFVSAQEKPLPVQAVGIPDRYLSQGTQQELKQECGLTTEELEMFFAKEFEKISKKD